MFDKKPYMCHHCHQTKMGTPNQDYCEEKDCQQTKKLERAERAKKKRLEKIAFKQRRMLYLQQQAS